MACEVTLALYWVCQLKVERICTGPLYPGAAAGANKLWSRTVTVGMASQVYIAIKNAQSCAVAIVNATYRKAKCWCDIGNH